MKIVNLAIPTLAITLICGCSEVNETLCVTETPLVITASIHADDKTKTTLQDAGTSVYWEVGDEIKVFYGKGTGRFTSANTEIAKTANFTGQINTVIGSDEGFVGGESMWGLYPYRSDATYDGTSVTTFIPSQQTGKADSFAKNMNISLAKSSNLALSFYNVCGGLRFSVTRNDITDVIFEGLNDEDLTGKIKVTFSEDVPVIQQLTDGQKKITLKAPNNGTFEAGKWYYIIAAPDTLTKGFKLTFNTAAKSAELDKNNEVVIKRGIFGSLQNIDEGLEFADKKDCYEVTVETKGTLGTVLSSYDKKSIKGLKISGVLNDEDFLEIFYELPALRHLDIADVNITELPNHAFYQSKNVTSIVLPKTLITIGGECFESSVIQNVDMGKTQVANIEDEAFYQSRLETITIPASLLRIGVNAFGYTKLTTISLPTGLKTIDKYAFSESSVTEIIIPSSIDSLGTGVFDNCSHLERCTIENGGALHPLPGSFFSGCTKLTEIIIPDNITEIAYKCFYGCNHLSVADLSNAIELVSIGDLAFCGCDSLEICTMPETGKVQSIGKQAFYDGATLLDFVVPQSVCELGEQSFRNCLKMTSFKFSDNSRIKSLPSDSTYKSLYYPYYYEYYGIFENCISLIEISLPDSLEYIGKSCFKKCSSLKKAIFKTNGTTKLVIDGCMCKTYKGAYYYYGAFSNCSSLSEIRFNCQGSQITIGDYAFYDSGVLAKIDMSSCTNIKSIGEKAFYSSNKLYLVKIGTQVPPGFGDHAFGNELPYAVLKVPAGSVDAYKATGWNVFPQISSLDD